MSLGALAKSIKAKWNLSAPLHLHIAPQNVPSPYACFFFIGGTSKDTFNTMTDEVRVQFSLFSEARGSEEVWTLYEALEKLFDYCELAVEDAGFMEMRRTTVPIVRRDPDDGWWQLTVDYRVMLYKGAIIPILQESGQWTGTDMQFGLKGLASDGDYLYVGIVDPPSVVKVDLATMLTVATWTCGEGSIAGILSLCLVGGFLYAGKEDAVGANCIFKIDPSDMSQVSAHGYAGRYLPRALVSDGTYLYVAMGNYAVKIQLSNMTKTAEKYIAASVLYDIALGGAYLYVISRVVLTKIYQINPNTMVQTDMWTGATGQDSGESLVWFGTHIYAGLDAGRSVVIRLDPATLTIDRMWQEEEASTGHPCLCTDGVHIFVSSYNAPAKIYVLDKNFNTVAEWNWSGGEEYCLDSLIYSASFIFAGLSGGGSPPKAVVLSV
jgi:hypothetical protein